MDTKVLSECTALAFQNKITFPEVVRRMAATGVERYCADLVTFQKIIYNAEGQHHTEPLPLKNPPSIAKDFSQPGVQDAIRTIQKGEIDYPEFLRRIMKAGIVYYDVFIQGHKAIYTARDGEFHIEPFPTAK